MRFRVVAWLRLLAVKEIEPMMCSRCQGWLWLERAQTAEGWLDMLRCIVCGQRFEKLINQHRRTRPEPARQIPTTRAKRLRVPPG